MQTIKHHEHRGTDYTIVTETNPTKRTHFIKVFAGGRLCPVAVCGKADEFPQVFVRVQGAGWLHACEILTDWDKLNPDNYLCWAK